jgi:hypothetical protein
MKRTLLLLLFGYAAWGQNNTDQSWYLLSVRIENFDGINSFQDFVKAGTFQSKKINHSNQSFSSAFGGGIQMLTNPIVKYKRLGIFPHFQLMYNQFTASLNKEKVSSVAFNFGTFIPIPLKIRYVAIFLNMDFGPRFFFACNDIAYSQNTYFEYGGGLCFNVGFKWMNYAIPFQFQWKKINNEQFAYIGVQFPFAVFAKNKHSIFSLLDSGSY